MKFYALDTNYGGVWMNDRDYMQRALDLAKNGWGWTSPNPMVGAVIVKDGEIIGEGWHAKYGELHAERAALAACAGDPAGATMYVTLEPCCHQGKQPPCTDAILEAKIARVVIGSADPNPQVAGKGVQILRDAGVEVTEGVLKEECDALNDVFFHYITTGQPFVVLKYAMTLDGKLAAYTGVSKWITGEKARAHVQLQRGRYRAIMVGVGTVLGDDPRLTCRAEGGRNPLRVICDTHLRTPLTAVVVQTAALIPTLIATCSDDAEAVAKYQAKGCQVVTFPKKGDTVDITAVMAYLGKNGVDSVLLEGGSGLHWSALEAGLVNKVQAYIAPKLLGGAEARSPVGGKGFPTPSDVVKVENITITQLGPDYLLEGEVKH